MSVNLHIDTIVLESIDLAPGQTQLLQQAVASQLTEMLTQQGIDSSSFANSTNRDTHGTNLIRLGHRLDAMSLGPQLANAIYANIPHAQLSSLSLHGGQS